MKIDRNTLEISDLRRQSDDRYWHAQTPIQRLRAVQLNRELAYGRTRSSQRFQRVLELEGVLSEHDDSLAAACRAANRDKALEREIDDWQLLRT